MVDCVSKFRSKCRRSHATTANYEASTGLSIIWSNREGQRPLGDIASSTAPSETLESPERRRRSDGSTPSILCMLLLMCGILMLLVRGPLHAPPFESLTQYWCDPLPSLPSLGNRFQQYGLRLTCHTQGKLIYQRESISNFLNQSELLQCKRSGGLTRIWRMAPPDTYGEIVFHATCGDQIVILYKDRAAKYEANKFFITALAGSIIIVSAVSLFIIWIRRGSVSR